MATHRRTFVFQKAVGRFCGFSGGGGGCFFWGGGIKLTKKLGDGVEKGPEEKYSKTTE